MNVVRLFFNVISEYKSQHSKHKHTLLTNALVRLLFTSSEVAENQRYTSTSEEL